MSIIEPGIAYTFDDLVLIPRYSDIQSRFNGEIDLSTKIASNISLKHPIISANMDTITGEAMLLKMDKLGCLGIHHRFCSTEVQVAALSKLPRSSPKIACIGVGKKEFERLEYIMKTGPCLSGVLIDIAHGYHMEMAEQIHRVKKFFPKLSIVTGNVATARAADYLYSCGADCIKVGVGPGSLCTTRLATGNGYPQLSAILEIAAAREATHASYKIIADGGIRYPADVVKSLAAGADAVMIGSLFAGTEETPGTTKSLEMYSNGSRKMTTCKLYRGMASFGAQRDWKGSSKGVEGEEVWVPYIGPVQQVVNTIIDGVLSGMSYQGAHNLEELQKGAIFKVQTAAAVTEAQPHRKLKRGDE